MYRMLAAGVAAIALLGGCAVPEAKLRKGLVQAGVARPQAACMAERMVDRLNLAQLMRIGDLPRAGEAATLARFLHRVRALGDPEIWSVTSTSAALCTAGLAPEAR